MEQTWNRRRFQSRLIPTGFSQVWRQLQFDGIGGSRLYIVTPFYFASNCFAFLSFIFKSNANVWIKEDSVGEIKKTKQLHSNFTEKDPTGIGLELKMKRWLFFNHQLLQFGHKQIFIQTKISRTCRNALSYHKTRLSIIW